MPDGLYTAMASENYYPTPPLIQFKLGAWEQWGWVGTVGETNLEHWVALNLGSLKAVERVEFSSCGGQVRKYRNNRSLLTTKYFDAVLTLPGTLNSASFTTKHSIILFQDCSMMGGLQAFVGFDTPDINDRSWPATAALTPCTATPGTTTTCISPQDSVCPPNTLGNWVVIYKAGRLPDCAQVPPGTICTSDANPLSNILVHVTTNVWTYPGI